MLNIFSLNKQAKKRQVSNPKFITEADEIYKMLKHICDEQIPLVINWENNAQEETTYLLKVGTELFIIDRLGDPLLHESLLVEGNIKVQAKVHGVNVTFNVNIPDCSPEANHSYYKAPLPEKIYNPQRRGRFRATIPEGHKIPFIAKYGLDEIALTGELLDLTADGLAIMLDSRVFARKGERIKSCTISPPNGHVITFDIEIRSTRPCERNEQMMRVGAQIVDPNRKTLKQLRKVVLSLEELELKRKKERAKM
ncbi:MAG: hypothetical protein DRQ61_06910 [Gammaproteobacteria bacterium]|nr:MAG: hypothetical protein DRQ56_06990 [Gammaproteobacteria bacterium]RLA22208.1 MAG: hypothetical protein DRQ61_06910 [Gammaproteobacteria bacterium]